MIIEAYNFWEFQEVYKITATYPNGQTKMTRSTGKFVQGVDTIEAGYVLAPLSTSLIEQLPIEVAGWAE